MQEGLLLVSTMVIEGPSISKYYFHLVCPGCICGFAAGVTYLTRIYPLHAGLNCFAKPAMTTKGGVVSEHSWGCSVLQSHFCPKCMGPSDISERCSS